MIDHVLTIISQHGTLDLLLIFLGFGAGFTTQLRLPISLTIFMIRIIKWWLDTHPHGQEIKEKTNFNKEFEELFGVHLHEGDGQIPAEPIDKA